MASKPNDQAVGIVREVLSHLASRSRIDTDLERNLITIGTHAEQYEIRPVWVGEGYPRDVRAALNRSENDPRTVLVARRFSPGAMAELGARNQNWADSTGRALIVVPPGLYVSRGRETKPDSALMTPAFKWSKSATALGEWILTRNRGGASASKGQDSIEPHGLAVSRSNAISEAIDLSPSQISKTLQQFDQQGWTVREGSTHGSTVRRTIVQPGHMLDSWAADQRSHARTLLRVHTTERDLERLIASVIRPKLAVKTWALSGWPALARVAPYTTDIPTMLLYVQAPVFDHLLPELVERNGLRKVTSGARVTFVRASGLEIELSRSVSDAPVVSDVRLFADLGREGIRGEDAADHLRESIIGF